MRQIRKKRIAIMVVCEGKTEENLWRWLRSLMRHCPIAIHCIKCRGGGDAYSVLEWAAKQYGKEKKSRDLDHLIVMLDTDRGWDQPDNKQRNARQFAQKKKMITILCRPRCEHFLMGLKKQEHRLRSCLDPQAEKKCVEQVYGKAPQNIDWEKQGVTLRDIMSRKEFDVFMAAFPFLWKEL